MPVNIFNTFDDPFALGATFASGINASGQIVGYYRNARGFHGFLQTQGTYFIIDDPLATGDTVANGINAAGQVVGSYQDASLRLHGFLLNGVTYTTLDDPLGTSGTTPSTSGTNAIGINDKGQVVGTYNDASGTTHGFLYAAGAYTTIDDPLATLVTAPQGINS